MEIFHKPNYDFIRWRWYALALSLAVILAGAATVAVRGLPLGVEFSGGTVVIVKFDQLPSLGDVRTALDRTKPGLGQDATIQRYGQEAQRQLSIRLPTAGAEEGVSLTETANMVRQALSQANVGKFEVAGTEIVGSLVGRDLTRKGILATVLALGGILVYIAFRFRFSFAVGAVVATVHDILVMLSFLAFFRHDLSLNVIAAILTMAGYSVNDTIVIFDRVRENLRGMRRDSLTHIVNVAVNQTLGRTIITSGTALLSVLALFFFGGDVLHGFAFTMLVGIITGTYSTVFIASAIVTFWRSQRPARAQAAPQPTAEAPPRSKKANRKARAS
jgi:preprotein translocase subunit SecF